MGIQHPLSTVSSQSLAAPSFLIQKHSHGLEASRRLKDTRSCRDAFAHEIQDKEKVMEQRLKKNFFQTDAERDIK